MVARPWSSSRLSCGERLVLGCDGNAGNSFPTSQGQDPSSRAMRRKRGTSGYGGTLVLPLEWRRVSGKFLRCSKGVKDPLEVPEVRCDSLETPQRKWASSRLEGRTSWIFSSCGMCSRITTGTSGTRSVTSGNASPLASCSGALGIPLPSLPGPNTLCGVGAGT